MIATAVRPMSPTLALLVMRLELLVRSEGHDRPEELPGERRHSISQGSTVAVVIRFAATSCRHGVSDGARRFIVAARTDREPRHD